MKRLGNHVRDTGSRGRGSRPKGEKIEISVKMAKFGKAIKLNPFLRLKNLEKLLRLTKKPNMNKGGETKVSSCYKKKKKN